MTTSEFQEGTVYKVDGPTGGTDFWYCTKRGKYADFTFWGRSYTDSKRTTDPYFTFHNKRIKKAGETHEECRLKVNDYDVTLRSDKVATDEEKCQFDDLP